MNRVHAVVVTLVLSTAFAWAPTAWAQAAPTVSPSEACIAGPARAVSTECPNDGPHTFSGKAPSVSFHSAPSTGAQKTRDPVTKPGTPGQVSAPQRDERKSRLHAREKALLVIEIQKLENLYAATPSNAPDRVQVVRRLAEDYVELERAAFEEKTVAEIDRDAFRKAGNPRAAAQKQATVNADNTIMTSARTKAESLYDLIIGEYPAYPQLDEVLYYLAYEYEQAGDNDKARKAYFKLIQTRPDSRYIPNAYLAFGELFFNEAEGDPSQWENAKQAYVKVIGYPPQHNHVYGYAWYKLAYVFWNRGEHDKALNAFKKTIDYGVAFSQVPNAGKLAESARKDIVPVYAQKGDPGAAYNFFHPISGDPAGTNERTFKMMDDLGSDYVDTGHYPEAILLYKDLIARDPSGPGACTYQAHISEATMAMRSGNKDAIVAELDSQLRSHDEYRTGNHPAEARQECASKTAALLTETAMAWHIEAVGSPGQRGTGDPRTMKAAAALYAKVVATWSREIFAQFQFPRIVKDDWPTLYKVKYAMADLLYFQQRWRECGPAFDSVLAENPSAPEAPEAAYASVLCYQNHYEQIHKGGDDRRVGGVVRASRGAPSRDEDAKLAPEVLTDDQKGMITSFNRYICYVHPDKTDRAGQEQFVEVQYARAHTYFEARYWEEAATLFRDIAMNHPETDVGIYAAQLYLESINAVGSHSSPPRTACFDDITADVPRFIELYCTSDRLQRNIEPCTSLTRVQCDTQRYLAQRLTEQADRGAPNALALYEQAAGVLMTLWRRYGEAPLTQNPPAQCDRMDEIVYNAAKDYQAARLMAKAIAARMVLVNPVNRMDKSELARKATYEIGANYQAIAVYDLASTWYERYADLRPTPLKADSALRDAVQLRLGLGQENEALQDAMTFRASFGATKAQEIAAIQLAIGAHFASKEDWDRARGALEGAMSLLRRAPPDIQIQAHATLAAAFAHLHGDESRARAEYAAVRSLWSDPDASIAKIKEAYATEDDGARGKRVAKTLNAVGEAYFFAAEEARRSIVEPLRFPEYHGPGNKADVAKHIHGKVRDWYERKKAAIEQVEPDYFKILDLKPAPPPKWVIAAGARSGLMWGRFVDEFREAPIPAEWRNDPELRAIYEDGVYKASEPFKAGHAKPALKKCLDLSVAYQYFDGYSRDCEVWLGKNYKSEYHVVDELRGAPTLSNSALGDRPPPLMLTGPMWRASPLERQSVGWGDLAGLPDRRGLR